MSAGARPGCPSYRAAQEPDKNAASMPATPASSSATTCRGPNDRSSSSVSGPVSGESAALTSRVLPSLRDVTTPVSSALAIPASPSRRQARLAPAGREAEKATS